MDSLISLLSPWPATWFIRDNLPIRHSEFWKGAPIDHQVIHVFDISNSSNVPSRHVDSWFDDRAPESFLQCLSPQATCSTRVYLVHDLGGAEKVNDKVSDLIGDQARTLSKPLKRNVRSHYHLPQKVNKLQADKVPWWQSDLSLISCLDWEYERDVFTNLIRYNVRVRCVQDQDGRLVCFILCSSACIDIFGRSFPSRAEIHDDLSILVQNILDLHDSYPDMSQPSTTDPQATAKDIFKLCISHAILLQHANFFRSIEQRYTVFKNTINPAYSTITPTYTSQVGVLIEAASMYDGLRGFGDLIVEMRALRAQFDQGHQDIGHELDSSLRFLEIVRDAQAAKFTRPVNFIAVIYLPCSLTASVLSMSTPLVDLGARLFDFFGTTFLLVNITALVVILTKVVLWLNFQLTNIDRDSMPPGWVLI
ncbi:hypothetical protein BJX70DRAFT_403925 [Aspergillus crustosus]